MFKFLREPADIEPIKDENIIAKTYKKYRVQIFTSSFLGYTMFHLCKKNISVALPAMGSELGYTNTQLGILGSSLYFTYAFGKFINGVLADRSDARKFFSLALLLSAITNILFGLSFYIIPGKLMLLGMPALLWVLAFFWGLNGWFQSMGFPAIAKSLTYWFSNTERGTKWALWSTSHQFGLLLTAFLSGLIISKFGWQAAFIIPGIINIGMSIYLFRQMRDKPSTLGLPDVEQYYEKTQPLPEEQDAEANLSYLEIFKKYILFNRIIWMLALAYVFVYILRYGTEDWIVKYMVEIKHNTIEAASFKLGCLSFFGALGVVASGWCSDTICKGRRMPVNIFFLAGLGLSIGALIFTPASWHLVDTALISAIGFFTAGPQMMIGGLCAVESASKKVASAACGFTGIFGYVGAVLTSVGTGFFVDHYGWNAALIYWIAAAAICILICIPLLKTDKK